MSVTMTSITLSEWESKGPDNCAELAGRFLDSSQATHRVVERLTRSKLLKFTELRHGLQIKASSHVGRIRLGDLNITILPKINGTSLLSLVRYACGFRRLKLISESTHLVDQRGFEDLLVSQLNAEVHEVIARGLFRTYVSTNERLASPRGRIDLTRMALDGGIMTTTLPCQHHPRIEDTLLNRVVMAGLRLAGSIASVIELQRESRWLASVMGEQVSTIRLNGETLDRATRLVNRLTAAYSPALKIIRLLLDSQGVVFEGQTITALPGFLFDMNAFFQALVSRFLRENLDGYFVHDEHGLKGMMWYNPKFNPNRRQSPTPRPDYVVMQNRTICSILDAKYRDLWEQALPREMLYQLVVYAISHRQQPQSAIIYPTSNVMAKEARIDVTDPIFGRHLAQVCLRPLHLPLLEKLVSSKTAQDRREREACARRLAFGE